MKQIKTGIPFINIGFYTILLMILFATSTLSKETNNIQNKKPQDSNTSTNPRRTGPKYTDEYIQQINLIAEGVGVGYDLGFWQPSVDLGIRVSVPMGKLKKFGMQFRIFMPMGELNGPFDPVINLGVEWFYRSPVLAGIVRIYIGGGLWMGIRPITFKDDDKDKPIFDKKYARFGFAGGGKIGFEFFIAKNKSYFIEVGGQGPGHALWKDMGAHVLAGGMWYFGK